MSARLSPAAHASDGRSFTLFLPLALPFAILAGVAVFAAVTPAGHQSASTTSRPGALVWGDGIFANRAELKAWLRLHQGSYRRWVQQHPAAVKLVTHRARPVRAHARATASRVPAPTQRKTPVVKAPVVKTSALRQPVAHTSTGTPLLALMLIVLLGLLALAAAILPARLLVRVAPSAGIVDARRLAEVRVAVGFAGLSILCGFGLALLLG